MSEEKKHYQRPLNFKTGKVEMNFGAGGKASAQLIADLFAKNFSNEFLIKAMTAPDFLSLKANLLWPLTHMS